MTQYADGDCVDEATIRVGQCAKVAGERGVKWHAPANRRENGQRSASRREPRVAQSSMPEVGLDGMATSRRGIRPAR